MLTLVQIYDLHLYLFIMAINIIKEEIKIILETLSEQYVIIDQHKEHIPQIELDIVLANIRKLYERVLDLNKINLREAIVHDEKTEEVIPEKKVEKTEPKPGSDKKIIEISFAEKLEETVGKQQDEKPEPSKEEQADIPETKDIEASEPPKVLAGEKQEKPAKTGKKDSTDLFSMAEKETLADKFKEVPKSMHDKIATEKPDKTLADKIGKSSIANLKTAIGINDKFLFINELFKGDIQEYNKTIDKLNSYAELDETTGFLEELKTKYNWSEKPEAYQKLEDLIIRKFL